MTRVSGGLFKNRIRKPRKLAGETRGRDDGNEPTASDDDLSFSSHERESKAVEEDTRWSVAVDKNLNQESDDEDEDDDIYMSDQAEDTAQTSQERDIAETAPKKLKKKKGTKKNADGVLKKKKKKIAETEEPTKKKKKKGKSKKTKDDNSTESKSGKKKKKKSKIIMDQPPKGEAAEKKSSITKVYMKSSFFQNRLYMSICENTAFKRFSTIAQGPSSSPMAQSQESPASKSEPKEVDGKKLKADAVSKIRAFAIFRDRIQDQKQFLTAFDENEQEKDGTAVANKGEHSQDSFNKLVKELQECETMLEKQRAEMSDMKASMELQLESVEQLLNEETQKNEELQLQIQDLQEQLEISGEAVQLEALKEKNRMLQAQNELLQQKTERQQETISSMIISENQAEMKRKQSSGPSDSNASLNSFLKSPSANRRKFRPARPSISEEGSMELREEEDDSPDWDEQSGYMSISSMPGKAQGELLQLRSTVKSKNQALEEQAQELAKVRQELETLKEEQGVKSLTGYVENLQNEKKFFVSEIDKLKKELAESRKREQETASRMESMAAVPATSKQADSEPANSGWFGFGARTQSKVESSSASRRDDDRTKEIVNDLNGTSMAISESAWGPEPERAAKSLSDLLDF